MEEERWGALDGQGVDLNEGGLAVEVDTFCAEVAFHVVRVEPHTTEPDRLEQLLDGRLVARCLCRWDGKGAERLCRREGVGWVDGSALRVEAWEVSACASDAEEGHVPILEALTRFALQQLLEAREHASAVREGEGEAEGALDEFWVDVWVGEDAEGTLETEAVEAAGEGRFLKAVGVRDGGFEWLFDWWEEVFKVEGWDVDFGV